MRKMILFLAIPVLFLASGLLFVSCNDGGVGTIQIRINNIPPEIMTHVAADRFSIFLSSVNRPLIPIAIWDSSKEGEAQIAGNSYSFFMYNLVGSSKFIGPAGNYNIRFVVHDELGGILGSKMLSDVRLEVLRLNTVSYNNFN